MRRWALDLGTANTVLARWNAETSRPEMVELPEICRVPEVDDPLLAPRTVPSATHALVADDLWTRLGQRSWLANRVFWGAWGLIGVPAIEKNLGQHATAYVPTFKRFLGRASAQPLARHGQHVWTARDIARIFLRELLASTARATGERIRDLVVTVPVESFETYRAELGEILKGLGVQRVRFVDEPVAAAVGYGLGQRARRNVLVVDFGAGTMHTALVRMGARSMADGACEVLAKTGRAIGGDHVDDWIVAWVLGQLGVDREPDGFWRGPMRDEARRIKELTYARGRAVFQVFPPDVLRAAALRGGVPEIALDQATIQRILAERGLPEILQQCLDELEASARPVGGSLEDVDDVLMVGGSTLLPGVYSLFEARFGRDRVRAFRPFEAVAFGAAAIAGGASLEADHLVHSYAIRTVDARTGAPEFLTIVPRGTRFPTAPDLWRQHLVPTCPLGEPESVFKLVICEVGHATDDARLFGWGVDGQVQVLRSGGERLVVPLNQNAPTLGHLDPPHPPGDARPRLDVCFGVNGDRWLVATVRDLWSGKVLMTERPVVRLM